MRRDFTSPDDEYVDTPQEQDIEQHEQRRRRSHADEPPPEPTHHNSRQEYQTCAARNRSEVKIALKETQGKQSKHALTCDGEHGEEGDGWEEAGYYGHGELREEHQAA
jgi:hypothetical protein